MTVPLRLPDDFEDPLISIDLVCRRDNDPLTRELIQAAEEAANIIWFNR